IAGQVDRAVDRAVVGRDVAVNADRAVGDDVIAAVSARVRNVVRRAADSAGDRGERYAVCFGHERAVGDVIDRQHVRVGLHPIGGSADAGGGRERNVVAFDSTAQADDVSGTPAEEHV